MNWTPIIYRWVLTLNHECHSSLKEYIIKSPICGDCTNVQDDHAIVGLETASHIVNGIGVSSLIANLTVSDWIVMQRSQKQNVLPWNGLANNFVEIRLFTFNMDFENCLSTHVLKTNLTCLYTLRDPSYTIEHEANPTNNDL